MIGPATAIRNSPLALVGSSCISATPPKMNRVMPRIGMLNRRVTREWASSWSTIEAARPISPAMPIHQ